MIRKIIIVCLLITCLYAQTATPPSAGDGTESNPYQIASLSNLYWISNNPSDWDKHYIQTADINAVSTINWFSGSGWFPIGIAENKFTGSYHGNGYSINNLYIDRKTSDYNGLFGYILNSEINSLGLNNIDYTAKNYTGGLIGKSDSSIVKNCFTTGRIFIDGEYEYTGGLIGDCRNTTVSTSYAQTDIEIGLYSDYTGDTVYRAEYIGGLIGYCKDLSAVYNCYATGDVGNESYHTVGTTQRGSNYVGGLIGYQYYYCSVEKCYSTGKVEGTGVASRNGGLIGEGRGSSYIKNCFWDTETSCWSTSDGGIGKTSSEMKTLSTFTNAGWDTENIWTQNDMINDGYLSFVDNMVEIPIVLTKGIKDLKATFFTVYGQLTFGEISSYGVCWNTTGDPTISDNFIENQSDPGSELFTVDVSGLAVDTKYYFKVFVRGTSGVVAYGEELNTYTWPIAPVKPQGVGSLSQPYLIATLENLFWIRSDTLNMDKRFVQINNINAANTKNWNGGVGWMPIGEFYYDHDFKEFIWNVFKGHYNGNSYTIDSLYIYRPEENYQGLFGYTGYATIINLGLNDCEIFGDWSVGALVGSNGESIISNCYSSGNVNGSRKTGGLVGGNFSSSLIYNSYSTASSSSSGFVGQNSDNAEIVNCYSCGFSSETGFVDNNSHAFILNSYWDIEFSGQALSDGGEGLSTLEMKTDSTFINAGWDFETIWGIDNSVNNGYPAFISEIRDSPILYTKPIFHSQVNSALIQCDMIHLGKAFLNQHGICWNTTGLPTLDDEKIELGTMNKTGTFSATMTDLQSNTDYYVRSFIKNDTSIVYGNLIHFETVSGEAAMPDGGGTAEDPYQISSLENLVWLQRNSDHWDKHYIQMADINLSECAGWAYTNEYYGWIPIGNQGDPFTGTYNGQHYKIDSLTIVNTSRDDMFNQGLFGVVKNADIRNMGLTNTFIRINDGEKIGSLTGYCDSSNIENCYAVGAIWSRKYVGGLIGYLNNSSVNNCYVKNDYELYHDWGGVKVFDEHAGGISGYSVNSSISNCYNCMYIYGRYRTNPISSWDSMFEYDSTVIIDKCYSTSAAQSMDCFFGIPGSNNYCEQTWYPGGHSQKYFMSSIRTREEMKDPQTYLNAGWDFVNETANGTDDIWNIDTSEVINEGYPYLSWEYDVSSNFTSLEDIAEPESFMLNQNYPNPFNPITTISYQLSAVSNVELAIYDLSGRRINQWSYQNQATGTSELTWNGKDQNGNPVPSGVYIYRMVAGGFVESKKMVLLK